VVTTLVDRNNDPEDGFHFNMYSAFVIGRDLNAARDIVQFHLALVSKQHSSPNRHRMGFGFGVNSVGSHNHPLCWSIIPHQTEGELTYTSTFLE
jgi:hypothetical protein